MPANWLDVAIVTLLTVNSKSRSMAQTASSDEHGRATTNDDAAMCSAVAHADGRKTADENGSASGHKHVGRPDTDGHIRGTCGRKTTNQHRHCARRQNWPADMRHWAGCHRADMHIRYTCSRLTHRLSLSAIRRQRDNNDHAFLSQWISPLATFLAVATNSFWRFGTSLGAPIVAASITAPAVPLA